MFNDKATNGKKTKVDEYTYEDDNFTYTIDGSNLIVVDKMLGEYITILNFKDGALGIGLETDGDDKKAIELFVGDATTTEGGDLTFTVAITDTLKYDLTVDVGSYFNGSADASDLEGAISGTVVIKAGESSADFTIKSKTDDIDEGVENFIFAATGYSYAGEGEDDNDLGSLLIKNASKGSIDDGTTPQPLEISVSDASLDEANVNMSFSVTLTGKLKDGEKYSNLMINNYKNLNKRDIMINILKRVA